MDLRAPFTGVLYMPDKEFLSPNSPVMLPDGQVVAGVGWHTWTQRFEVLDAAGGLVAECRPSGFFRKRYTVRTPDGQTVVDLLPGGWRPINGAAVTLGSGRPLSVRQTSMWSERRFEFFTEQGLVGRIDPTTGVFTFHPDSYAFELSQPVMSALEAISLAQALRLVVRAMRQSRSNSAATS
jgi:hypothetical protein